MEIGVQSHLILPYLETLIHLEDSEKLVFKALEHYFNLYPDEADECSRLKLHLLLDRMFSGELESLETDIEGYVELYGEDIGLKDEDSLFDEAEEAD